ncbi:uncharacterized protein MONBRDRAFT_36529 [Monosiga brevicollis MX1]|uniref:P-type domain-containing protein n=1 Tax=Monosiga brevicollis TaxID=81824 RepID=A9UVU5_MONBE|nr:uncharacterized protein MONBRDRAFT_36529 [Monosiga brevicollis MX1]EDQ90452.1 predicted protein [Monosiga brevicollis MX1]|eukprot:XP_001744503.1 hypothetical protein [Monosiga brevicollis MX1]
MEEWVCVRAWPALVLLASAVAVAAESGSGSGSGSCALPEAAAPLNCGGMWRWDSEAECTARGCCWQPSNHTLTWCYYPDAEREQIDDVYVVQGCHFDAGFADTLPVIVARWFNDFFPLARTLGRELQARNASAFSPQLKFTAQSWLVWLYINCEAVQPPGIACPNATAIEELEEAVRAGYITWQAFPHNAQLELLSATSLELAVRLTHDLDDHFNVTRKTVLSQRDVPGLSRGVLAPLQAAGVQAISVGSNGGSTPPNVPRAFRWLDPVTNASLLTMYLSGGYGGISQFKRYHVPTRLPGSRKALIIAWNGDNSGPLPTVDAIIQQFEDVQAQFPGARVRVAAFEEYLEAVTTEEPAVLANLPVLSHELGDTWLHGVASDPRKLAKIHQLDLALERCLSANTCTWSDPAVQRFFHAFLKGAEHTWGLDVKSTLINLRENWSNVEFEQARHNPDYERLAASWVRQDTYGAAFAQSAVANTSLGDDVARRLAALEPVSVDPTNWTRLPIDSAGQYHTYSALDYDEFLLQYNYIGPLFMLDDGDDFNKMGIDKAGAQHRVVSPQLQAAYLAPNNTTLLARLVWPADVVRDAGAPLVTDMLWQDSTSLNSSGADTTSELAWTVIHRNKTATRLPEAMFLRVVPTDASATRLRKVATEIQGQLDVVDGGALHNHIVDRAEVRLANGTGPALALVSEQARLLSVGACPTPFPAPVRKADLPEAGRDTGSLAALLWNNIWGTNYIMWLDGDLQFNGTLTVSESSSSV